MNDRKGWAPPRDDDGVPLIDTAAVVVVLRTEYGGSWNRRRALRWLTARGITSPRRGAHGAAMWRHADVGDAIDDDADVAH